MAGSADIIITVRSDRPGGEFGTPGWLELESLYLDRRGIWTVEAACGCVASQLTWRRCHDHRQLELLCIQTRLPFDIAES